jgi:hypothetical protein
MHDAKTHSDDKYMLSEEEFGGQRTKVEIRRQLVRADRSKLWTLVYHCIGERVLANRRMTSRTPIPIRRPLKTGPKDSNLWSAPKKPSQCYWDPQYFNTLPEERRARQLGHAKVVFPHPPPGVDLTKEWVFHNIVDNKSWFKGENLEKLKSAEEEVLKAYDIPSESDAARLLDMTPYSPSDSEVEAGEGEGPA